MNTKIRVCCMLLTATALTASPFPTASAAAHHDYCSRLLANRATLPRTADAAQGWFQACHARQVRLPATADGAAGWVGTPSA